MRYLDQDIAIITSLMKKIIFVFGVAVFAVIFLLSFYFFKRASPTPITDFSAPFIFGKFAVPNNNPLTNEAFVLGRRLFYDPLLSGNNQISCSHCHIQSLAFSDGRKFSIGVSKQPTRFNSMSLVNLLWGPQLFFWNGRVQSLEEQILHPLISKDEMDQDLELLVKELSNDPVYPGLFYQAYGEISIENLAKAIASFERMLISSDAKYDKYLRGEATLTDTEELGRKLFMAHPDVNAKQRGGNCIDCHSQFLTSGFQTGFDGFLNNGLDSNDDLAQGLMETTGNLLHKGLFKTPTLRNIELTAPYMHDGRFNTLEQVMEHYNSGIHVSETLSPLIMEANNTTTNHKRLGLNLTKNEQQAIIAFLTTLTDKQFINNPKFADPFKMAIP